MTEPTDHPERDERQFSRRELDEFVNDTVARSMQTVQTTMDLQFEELKKLIEKGIFPAWSFVQFASIGQPYR